MAEPSRGRNPIAHRRGHNVVEVHRFWSWQHLRRLPRLKWLGIHDRRRSLIRIAAFEDAYREGLELRDASEVDGLKAWLSGEGWAHPFGPIALSLFAMAKAGEPEPCDSCDHR